MIYATRQAGAVALGVALALPLLSATARVPSAVVAPQGVITGRAAVVDGDTIDIAGTRVRLEGIDAPEIGQTCPRADGGTWRCGLEAAQRLGALVAGRRVRCAVIEHDAYGRAIGICTAGDVAVNAAMVREGLAWAFVKYSSTYVAEEATARSAKAGIWQAAAMPAWDYRAKAWAKAEPQAPAGCGIKGNVTKNGRIYHMPWSPFYEKTRIEPAKGERWFCSEAEAAAAGWRPAAGP